MALLSYNKILFKLPQQKHLSQKFFFFMINIFNCGWLVKNQSKIIQHTLPFLVNLNTKINNIPIKINKRQKNITKIYQLSCCYTKNIKQTVYFKNNLTTNSHFQIKNYQNSFKHVFIAIENKIKHLNLFSLQHQTKKINSSNY